MKNLLWTQKLILSYDYEFISGEDRYRTLKQINPDLYKELLENNKDNAILRYNYFKELEEASKEN